MYERSEQSGAFVRWMRVMLRKAGDEELAGLGVRCGRPSDKACVGKTSRALSQARKICAGCYQESAKRRRSIMSRLGVSFGFLRLGQGLVQVVLIVVDSET